VAIRRSPSALRRNFTIVSNPTITDSRLSWEARGLLVYLLSKPDHWKVNVKHLISESPSAGREKIYRILNELEAAGYITQEQTRCEGGEFSEMERIVHDISDSTVVGKTVYGKTVNGSAVYGKPVDIVNTDLLVNTDEVEITEMEAAPFGADSPVIIEAEIYDPDDDEPSANDLTTGKWAEPHRLATLLATLIVDNGCKPPTITSAWVQDIEKTIRIDKRDPVEVEALIRWAQASDFWRANILSPAKFRKQYDRLRLQAEKDFKKTQPKGFSGIEQFLEEVQ
jgi:hypothetical protein